MTRIKNNKLNKYTYKLKYKIKWSDGDVYITLTSAFFSSPLEPSAECGGQNRRSAKFSVLALPTLPLLLVSDGLLGLGMRKEALGKKWCVDRF